jgi:hypothetical protein
MENPVQWEGNYLQDYLRFLFISLLWNNGFFSSKKHEDRSVKSLSTHVHRVPVNSYCAFHSKFTVAYGLVATFPHENCSRKYFSR